MLSNISWSQYLVVIAVLTVLWYVYVFFRFYAGNLKLKRQGLEKHTSDSVTHNDDTFQDEEISYESIEPGNEFIQVEALIEELRTHIEEDSKTTIINTNLAEDLKKIIGKYPAIKGTPYQSAINDLILAECARYGTDTIEDDEVEGLWE